jgi:UDP:flavonoid glycosyltransferase YjiC (YdhE family)
LGLKRITHLAKELPKYTFHIVGSYENEGHLPENIIYHGLVASTQPYLQHADVVLGSTGHNTLTEVAQANKPFITIPEDRPFDEQKAKANALKENNLAVVLTHFPDRREFEKALIDLRTVDMVSWGMVYDPHAALRFARVLEERFYPYKKAV